MTVADEQTIAVKMDERIDGAQDWDNEVIWSGANRDDAIGDLAVSGDI